MTCLFELQEARRAPSLPLTLLRLLLLTSETYGAVGGDLVRSSPFLCRSQLSADLLPFSSLDLQGTRVLTKLLQQFPKNVLAAHYTMLYGTPPTGSLLDYLPLPAFVVNWWKQLGVSDKEREALKSQERFFDNGMGYNILQQTRPATIGYALFGESSNGKE